VEEHGGSGRGEGWRTEGDLGFFQIIERERERERERESKGGRERGFLIYLIIYLLGKLYKKIKKKKR